MDARVLRAIEANANRVREGLRVAEDIARFVLNDASLSARIKSMRHELTGALELLFGESELLAARNTPGDVGKELSAPGERGREDLRGLVRANMRRAQEGLRVLEELSKLARPDAGEAFKRLRYAAYEVESALLASLLACEGDAGSVH